MHSVFDHAINLQNAQGELFTLVTVDADNAPATLVTTASSFVGFALVPGISATLAHRGMSMGRLTVDIGRTRAWQPALPRWSQNPVSLCDLARLLKEEGVPGGIRPEPEPANAAQASASRLLVRTTNDLEAALGTGDEISAYRHATGLVGLGGGLTPAGDDYLVGMCTAFALPGDNCEASRLLLARVVETNAHRTNDISRAALIQAARGRMRESIVELARTLVTGDRAMMPRRARRVLAIGHTSGTDIATGLLAGLRVRDRRELTRADPPRG